MLRGRKSYGLILILTILIISGRAAAADLVIGTRNDPTIDPHFLYVTSNIAYARHMFNMLVESDENLKLQPALAVSWKAIDDTTWEFKLRKGVKFHDGTEFTAKDVVFSIKRIPNVPNSPTPFSGTVRSIVDMQVVDPYTIRFKTNGVNPDLPFQLTEVTIVSEKAVKNATTADFNTGKATIGTGPYKFVEYVPGSRLVLERNEAFWGKKPVWNRVTFKVITDDAARAAALMSGDVDAIDFVPPLQAAGLEKNPAIRVYKRASDRFIYVFINVEKDKAAYITDLKGNPLPTNPLRNKKVRQALAHAVNREAICSQVMQNLAFPATQTIPKGWYGYNPNIKAYSYDPALAKKLLAEAGYPNGFSMTIHGSSDRYVNDAKVTQALGQMFARIGLEVKVDTMPRAVYFPKLGPPGCEFSIGLLGWGNAPVGTDGLVGLLHSYNKEKSIGQYNAGGYSNPTVDKLIEESMKTVDPKKREKLVQQASAAAMEDVAMIPLYTQSAIVAARKGLKFIPRADEGTLAMYVIPEK
jgi:peptide/nickel transport system substrate-binding protein